MSRIRVPVSRRTFLGATAVAASPIEAVSSPDKPAGHSNIKLGFSTGLDESLLRFMKQFGVEWIATALQATQGESVSEAVTRGAVLTGIDGATGGIGGPPGGPSGPWKESEVRQVIEQVERTGLIWET